MTQPRSLNSKNPFISTAREYREKGWYVLPLPKKKKEYPPIGFTGRAGRFADDEDLFKWLNDAQFSEGNIALRLGNSIERDGNLYEVIGIDVDAHSGKFGAQELSILEDKLGELPDTWTSSSRHDGVSGIRFYLVPYGYGFRGKASDSIDIVQRVHRYAVAYPSWHPDTKTQYFWYPPGYAPAGQGFSLDIPNVDSLPVLPDGWIDHLTRNRMSDTSFGDGSYGIDLDVSNEELMAWVESNFNPALNEELSGQCKRMVDAVTYHVDIVESSPSNHDKLINAHWNILHLCCEGHSGWKEAIEEVEAVWIKDVKDKGKRDLKTVAREIKRSFNGTLRKIKAKADSFKEQGVSFFSPEVCMSAKDIMPPGNSNASGSSGRDGGGGVGDLGEGTGHWIYSIPLAFKEFDPKNYDKNDVSQALHLRDRVGDSLRYLADYNAWVIYDENTWHIDDFTLVRDLFDRACIQTSKRRGFALQKKLAQHIQGGGTDTDSVGAPLKSGMTKLRGIAELYRNDAKVRAVLSCLKCVPGVAMRFNELNWDATILAMPNGKVLKLDEHTGKPQPKATGFRILDNDKSYYTTYATGVEYFVSQGISQREKGLWKGYLDLFLPDPGYRAFVQKVLGYIIIGGNPEKLAIFLVGPRNTGKSTMLQCIQSALGDYGATFSPNSVFKDAGGGNNPELGNLLHKRGIFSSESGSQRIYANPLKRNTGGDKISITRKYANDQIIGIPHFVPVVATNQSPSIDDADEALVKRILVCPFDVQVGDEDNDKRADVTLARDARHAIFNWLVLGYKRYVREGLSHKTWHPKAIAATLEFAAELSDVSTFLSNVCVIASDEMKHELSRDIIESGVDAMRNEWGGVSCNALYISYQNECAEAGQKPFAPRIFGKKVRQVFGIGTYLKRADEKVIRYYLGLKWKNQAAMNQLKG